MALVANAEVRVAVEPRGQTAVLDVGHADRRARRDAALRLRIAPEKAVPDN